eukprot:CAMPEP_0206574154 /NCGR_PEP_ID=MMETSP0325_2-20121206/29276_1 /ASSEMBLY_ACC=CAM_ASM_000347 /TAXON_ID=2866 /ORGANISM="Crypthecodinium cohnii, Strain Seligo" /LENGTH=233 /DNA_ID=CAMNT_0054078703 /DNA_START=261 /DNA_END=958 /DNA_ORIENTATION=-
MWCASGCCAVKEDKVEDLKPIIHEEPPPSPSSASQPAREKAPPTAPFATTKASDGMAPFERDLNQGDLASPGIRIGGAIRVFDVRIVPNGSEMMGLLIDYKQSVTIITGVAQMGAVPRHNSSASPDSRIEKFDFLLSVNGKSLKEDMIEELRSATVLDLRLGRSMPILISIRKKGGQHLGTSLCYDSDSRCIRVKELHAGAVKDYNASCPVANRLLPQDIIISVNGISEEPKR